jgi:DNA-binding NtrC family response regulator
MRSDISKLKTAVQSIIKGRPLSDKLDEHSIIPHENLSKIEPISPSFEKNHEEISHETLEVEPGEASNSSLSLQDLEIEMIKKAIERHRGRRKEAAEELGISERTLYRKIKQYDLG